MKYESLVRLGFFFAVMALMAGWEALAPRRRLSVNKPKRWFSNLGLVVVNTIAVRLAFALGAVGIALFAQEREWGLFNNLSFPFWLTVLLSVLSLDLAIYLQHVMFHAVPVLWRLHMVHHADLDVDMTTGLRFHTIEILLSMGLKGAAIILLGAPALAVLIFEVLLNATSMFNHSNVRMPPWLDRLLRLIVVTPDMHRVHHSVIVRETNSNFGFNLPWWDYLLGTYRPEPSQGHEKMTLGLEQFRDEQQAERLHWMLALPVVGTTGEYPIQHRAKESSQSEC